MSISKMKLVRISGPVGKLDNVILACCSAGDFHPENASKFVSSTMGYEAFSGDNPYTVMTQMISSLADEYDLDLSLDQKGENVKIDEEEMSRYIQSTGARIEEIANAKKELDNQEEQCLKAIEQYSHFQGLGLDFQEIFACKFIRFRFGRLPYAGYNKLQKVYAENAEISFYPCSSDDVGYWGAYVVPSESVAKVDRIFASLLFDRLKVPKAAGLAEEIVQNLNKNIEIVRQQKEELDKKLQEAWEENKNTIRAIYLRLQDLNEVYEVKKYALFYKNSCFLVGWIPASDEEKFKNKLKKFSGYNIDIEDYKSSDDVKPPTKLKNFRIFRPYEYFVNMYGLPSYDEIDITGFVAITYTLLFGMMFGDAGQGIVLLLVGLYLYKKKRSGLGKILVPCGLSATLFGCIYGSAFGFEDAFDPIYERLGFSGKPFDVMESINTVLLFAISIGIALVIVAMCLNIVVNIKKRKFGTALFSESGLVGIMTYFSGVCLIYQFMSKKAIIPGGIAAIMLACGLLLLFFKPILAGSIDAGKFKKPEKISDFIMQNFFETIEYVLSYFSNTVSFLRVGAFVIVHASMMMVVFTLAGDVSSVKGFIVVLLGNALVLVLEGLLSGIQGLRLEFYEMFSRFYEGDGKPFNPISLASKRKLNK